MITCSSRLVVGPFIYTYRRRTVERSEFVIWCITHGLTLHYTLLGSLCSETTSQARVRQAWESQGNFTSCDWATGVVVVPKKNGAIRLYGNYRKIVKPQLKTWTSPNIHIEGILADLVGEAKLSKLDLANAYNQIEVNEESTLYLTILTHNELFHQNRLVYGITTIQQYDKMQ